jgi:hypothetical protein
MHCLILISMLKRMMTFTCDQVSKSIPSILLVTDEYFFLENAGELHFIKIRR